MTLTLKLDLDIFTLDLHAEIQACMSVRFARIVRRTDTQTHRQCQNYYTLSAEGVMIEPLLKFIISLISHCSTCNQGTLSCTQDEDCDVAECGYDMANNGTTKLVKVSLSLL